MAKSKKKAVPDLSEPEAVQDDLAVKKICDHYNTLSEDQQKFFMELVSQFADLPEGKQTTDSLDRITLEIGPDFGLGESKFFKRVKARQGAEVGNG